MLYKYKTVFNTDACLQGIGHQEYCTEYSTLTIACLHFVAIEFTSVVIILAAAQFQ